MTADDDRPEDQWPLPPVWLWAGAECVRRYDDMKHAEAATEALWSTGGRGVDWNPMDSALTVEIRLAEHLAAEHRDLLSGWDAECRACAGHRTRVAREREPGRR